jgi:hypothetical protein
MAKRQQPETYLSTFKEHQQVQIVEAAKAIDVDPERLAAWLFSDSENPEDI